MRNLWLTTRSVLFYVGYYVSGAVLGVFTPGVALFPLRLRLLFYLTWPRFFIFWLRVCCGIRIRVSGLIPNRPCVLLSQHQSQLETFLLPSLLYPLMTTSVTKKSLLKMPLFGWALASVDPIAIDRDKPRSAFREVLNKGRQKIASDFCVIIYPEGTRSEPDQIGVYTRGGAALAKHAGVPIVPVAHNSGMCWPAHKFVKHPGTIELHFGQPLDSGSMDIKHLSEAAREWAVTCLQQRREASST